MSKLRVGIDVHVCRTSETGLYTFIRNVVEQLAAKRQEVEVTAILYGPKVLSEPASVERMKQQLSRVAFRHYWIRLAPWFGSSGNEATQASAGNGVILRLLQWLDRRVMVRLWRKLSYGMGGRELLKSPKQARRTMEWWNELDVVHHTAGLLLPFHPCANVLTINDLIPLRYSELYHVAADWFAESFERAREMDAILVYSEHTKAEVEEALGIETKKIHVVPLAAHRSYRPVEDLPLIQRVLKAYDLEFRSFVLHVGALEPRKNLVRLIEAYDLILKTLPNRRMKLVLAGPRVFGYEPIFEAITRLGLCGQVRWIGAVPLDHLPPLMTSASVFVYPSTYEGFGLPPLEAMACGAPVVAASTTSIPEVVGNAGILVDPLSVDELAAGIHRVLTDPVLEAELRARSVLRAGLFSWERTGQLTLEAYRAAVRSAGSTSPRKRRELAHPRNQPIIHNWLFDRFSDQLGR